VTDVFISFAARDRKVAERLLSFLEAEGVSCFFAPRDLEGGSHWHEGLYSAIDECRTVVLVLSSSSSRSQHVLREVDIAVEQRKPVLPIRIDRVAPSGGLGYLLRPFQFMQATRVLDDSELRSLLVAAKRLLGVSDTQSQSSRSFEDPTASLYRQLLLASDAHEVAILSEQVKVRLEASPQDIEMRMLLRQVSKVESALVPAPPSRQTSVRRGAMVSYAFVAMAGFGVIAYVLDPINEVPPSRPTSETPPPFNPPPEIVVQTTPPPQPPITAVTPKPPPAQAVISPEPPPVAARAAPPVAPPGRVSAEVVCSNFQTVMGNVAYPRDAQRQGIEKGQALIQFTLSPSGEIKNIRVLSASHQIFARNSVRIISQFQCKGQGHDVTVTVPFSYKLE
jgi:protein TonB